MVKIVLIKKGVVYMEEESKVQESAESEVCAESTNESVVESADVSCKCEVGNFKPRKCHKCRLLIACVMILLEVITVCLLWNIRCHMKHRMRRFDDFRPPIHRNGIKISVSEEPIREEKAAHEERPEMEHDGASDMHDQADPDMQAM